MSDTPQPESYLGDVDASLLERAVVGVLGAHVAILAPVTREGAVHTGEAAGREKSWLKRRRDTAPSLHYPSSPPTTLARHRLDAPARCVFSTLSTIAAPSASVAALGGLFYHSLHPSGPAPPPSLPPHHSDHPFIPGLSVFFFFKKKSSLSLPVLCLKLFFICGG